MRIIRLGNVELVRRADFVPHYFGDDVLFYIGPNGEFEFFKGKIAMGGIELGEWLVFSYAAKIVYVAVAESEVIEKDNGDKFFCIDKASIRKGNGKPFQDLQQELESIGQTILLRGQSWNKISTDDDDAIRILQKFVDDAAPLTKSRGGFEGRKACDIQSPARADVSESRIIRDSDLSRSIKARNDNTCQLCRVPLYINARKREKYAEAHHIQPLGEPHNGPDDSKNMICVCPNCHALLDYGGIALEDAAQIEGAHEIGQQFIDYHNGKIYNP